MCKDPSWKGAALNSMSGSWSHPSTLNQHLLNECPSVCPEKILKEVASQLGPAVWAEGREEDLSVHFVREPPLTSGLGFWEPVLPCPPPPPHPRASCDSPLFTAGPDGLSWWAGPHLTLSVPGVRPGAGLEPVIWGFSLERRTRGECWRNPTEEFNLEPCSTLLISL